MSDKTRKYLLYAIGEILLVVIGILIALQVNNWNEQRNQILSEQVMLESVIESLREDSVLFAEIQVELRQIDKTHRNIYRYLEENQPRDSVINIRYIRRSLLYNPVTMTNHPELGNEVINRELKQAVRMYFQKMDNIQFAINNFNLHLEDKIRPLLAELELLNYGAQYREEIDLFIANNLIRREAFIDKLNNPYLQQMLFESGLKYQATSILMTELQSENAIMIKLLENYLSGT